jgi:hypothetical protein
VQFIVEGLFKATLTLSGPEVTDRWFLLSVDFARGKAEEGKRACLSSSQAHEVFTDAHELVPPLNDQIVEAGNRILADEEQPDGFVPPVLPLYKLYSFLGRLASAFQTHLTSCRNSGAQL